MYRWMDCDARSEANAQATVWFGEAPTSAGGLRRGRGDRRPATASSFHATDEAYFDNIWFWSTPRDDCDDDDDGTTCKDFDDWIRGLDRRITGG